MSHDNGKGKTSKAKAKIIHDNFRENLEDAGFLKLEPKLVSARPPKIKWGVLYQGFNDKEKISYLEKVASSMNHAAAIIQEERNGLLKEVFALEVKIEKMAEALEQNNIMIQTEVDKINAERQKMNESGRKMKGDQIKEYLANLKEQENVDNSGSDS